MGDREPVVRFRPGGGAFRRAGFNEKAGIREGTRRFTSNWETRSGRPGPLPGWAGSSKPRKPLPRRIKSGRGSIVSSKSPKEDEHYEKRSSLVAREFVARGWASNAVERLDHVLARERLSSENLELGTLAQAGGGEGAL